MNVVWIIGFLFTMGILMENDDGTTPLRLKTVCVVMCLVTWPLYLGHLCAKFLVPPQKKDTPDATET